jgi:hypothetical protein
MLYNIMLYNELGGIWGMDFVNRKKMKITVDRVTSVAR